MLSSISCAEGSLSKSQTRRAKIRASNQFSVPNSAEEASDQAIRAAKAAWEDGITKQLIELPPPLTGATDLDDWPGGIRQMFSAILPSVEQLLVGIKTAEGLRCPLESQILDEGDAVGLWYGEKMKALLFPTSATVRKAREIGKKEVDLFLLVNPQWQEGQVISDFGFGRQKKEIEEFLSAFEFTYFLKQYRIQGKDLKVLRCYPDKWKIVVLDNEEQCIGKEETKPSYQLLESKLKEAGLISGSLFDKMRQEFDFNIKSLKNQ